MARARSPNRDKAYEIYKEHGGGITNRAIADELGIPEKSVGGWKCKDKWEVQLNGVLQKNERSTPKEKGAPKGNKNAVGHGAPKRNKNAEKHGLFSKYLPADALEIFDAIDSQAPIEMLWDSIKMHYTKILLAQQNNCDPEEFLQAQSRAMTTLNSMIKQYDELLRSDLVTEEQRARIEKLRAEVDKIKGDDQTDLEDDGFIDALSGKLEGVWADEETGNI